MQFAQVRACFGQGILGMIEGRPNMQKIALMMCALALPFAVIACGGSDATEVEASDKKDTTEASADAREVALSAENTTIGWTGYKVMGAGKHDGGFNKIDGNAWVKDGALEKIVVNIDIASMWTDDDENDEDADKLKSHLLNEDFFEVEKHPTGKFETTEIKAGGEGNATHTVTGNLTLKDITKSITFPATIKVDGEKITANASFKFDRMLFKIEYGSTTMGAAKDRAISDDVEMRINITTE